MDQSDSLNILRVISIPPFAWAMGGPARGAFDLSKELVNRGNRVTILTTDLFKSGERYPIKNPEFIDGVRIIRYKNISDTLAWKYKIFISPGMIQYLKKHVHEYDLVHLHDLISPQAIFTARYCQKNHVNYVLTCHGSICWLLQKSLINRLYYKLFGSKVIKNATKSIAYTPDELKQYLSVGVNENSVRIIPPGIDLLPYKELPEKGQFKIKNSIKKNQKLILYLGRIHEIKGIDLLLKSFSMVLKSFDNVKLIIVGPDDGHLSNLLDMVENLDISDKVIFTGPLYGRDKLEVYVDSDIFVLPSKYESFGNVILEAMACGTPVIITEKSAIADLLLNKVIVVKYEKNDLMRAILKLLNDEYLSSNLGDNGKKFVEKEFSWKNIIENVEKLYMDSIGCTNECYDNAYK